MEAHGHLVHGLLAWPADRNRPTRADNTCQAPEHRIQIDTDSLSVQGRSISVKSGSDEQHIAGSIVNPECFTLLAALTV